MHHKKSKKIIIYFFLLLFISSITNHSFNSLKFNKPLNIKVSGLAQKDNQTLRKKVESLMLNNIFFINKNELDEIFSSNSLIEKYEVFLKYPFTININIKKTNFLAKLNNNGKVFLIGSNGKLTPYKVGFSELPFIFGKPNTKEFLEFKKILNQSKFSYNEVKNFYFFPSKRWDIMLKNNILLKLPINLNQEGLNNCMNF